MWLEPVPRPTGSGMLAIPRQVHDVNTTGANKKASNTSPRRLAPTIRRCTGHRFGLPFALTALTPRLNVHRFGLPFALTALTPRLTGPALAVRRCFQPDVVAARVAGTT